MHMASLRSLHVHIPERRNRVPPAKHPFSMIVPNAIRVQRSRRSLARLLCGGSIPILVPYLYALMTEVRHTGLGVRYVGVGASYMWAAPEQLIGEPCSIASDIFALGVVIWELCTGEQPHGRQCRPLHPTEAPPPINELITRCRALNPAIRPSITEVYQVVAHQG